MSPVANADGVALRGSLYGGQQPIAGAHVYLLAAGTSGYGAASTSLLTIGDGLDSGIGTYVLTDANGNFTLTARYTCTPSAQVYALALGGSPGPTLPANSAIALMTALGPCPAIGTFAASLPFLEINEVTTVAAANALAGYMTGPSALSSSGTTLAKTGMSNAFSTSGSLASLATGSAFAKVGSNGIAPQAKVNTLADIIAACVNSSTGATSSACTTLFSNATSGTTKPTETITALLNIAHMPGANVTALYNLASSTSPFQPTLSSVPNDFALTITYTTPNLNSPQNIRTDASGNVWFRNAGGSFVLEELGPTGSVLSGSAGYYIGGQNAGDSVALDASGNVFVGNHSTFSIYELSSTGTMLSTGSGYTGGCSDPNARIYAVAVDGNGNAWGSGAGGCSLKVSNTGTTLSGASGFPSTSDDSSGIAIDSTNAAWIVGSYDNSVRRVSATGTVLADYGSTVSGPSGIAIDASDSAWIPNHYYDSITHLKINGTATMVTGAGIHAPFGVSIDGVGAVWVANNSSSISAVSNSGSALSTSAGYLAASSGTASSIATDGSGNVWTTVGSPDAIVEFVGIATPAARPILPGQLGARP